MASANRVAFDTNMLTAIYVFKVDAFEKARSLLGKVDFVIPGQVEDELQKLMKKGRKYERAASIAFDLLRKNHAKVLDVDAGNADDALLLLSKGAIIATNDKKLIKRVKKENGKVLFLRQKKYLDIK